MSTNNRPRFWPSRGFRIAILIYVVVGFLFMANDWWVISRAHLRVKSTTQEAK